jgi:hypothetical protein
VRRFTTMILRIQYDKNTSYFPPNSDIHFQSIKTMRTGSDYFLSFIRIQNFNIHHRLHLEQELISCSFAGSPVQLFGTSTAKGTFARFNQMPLLFYHHQNFLHNYPK